MTDDLIRRSLEDVEAPRRPDPAFAEALLEDLRQELGFAPAGTDRAAVLSIGGVEVRRRSRPGRAHRRWLDLLGIAAAIALISTAVIAVVGSSPQRVVPPANLLTQVRQAGSIRIAIRPDHPQFTIAGQAASGFDADVAREIARRLGVDAEVEIVDATTILAPGTGGDWDVALPSVASWTIAGSAFVASSPYYYWTHRLVVSSGSAATGVGDVASGPICAVAGDSGEAWLRGSYGGVAASPVTALVVTRATDADCLSALASGAVVAAVTARLSDADLQVRSDIRVIGGPAAEPRVAIVHRQQGAGPDPTDLMRAIDDALAAMRADGTLARLSQSRFGGGDLSIP